MWTITIQFKVQSINPLDFPRNVIYFYSVTFDFSWTSWGKRYCYNCHHYGPIVYFEDFHNLVFIVINIISYWWKNATISSKILLGWFAAHRRSKSRPKIVDDIYPMGKLVKLWGMQRDALYWRNVVGNLNAWSTKCFLSRKWNPNWTMNQTQ